ncbi:DGQHR domain-containing protein [Pseudomonas aeruginosa]
MEDTCTVAPGPHIAKKQIIFDLALKNKADFIKCLKKNLPDFDEHPKSHKYEIADYELRIVYFSMHSVDSEYVESATRIGIRVVERALANYFHALVKNISVSALYEILNYLKVDYTDVGTAKLSGGSSGALSSYQGFLLPEANSSYPDGFKVVSFYADPASLLKKSFVLRKNGWIEPNLSYQRILDMPKIKSMRQYLSENKRVYLGNIIATLPPTTKIHDIKTSDQLPPSGQLNVKPVRISLPDEYNVVGLIDGQHRVYSYHEGQDSYEPQIERLRIKQNLLITGIIYPETVTEEERTLFEARLFLEINSRQTKVKSALTQEIELIVNPFSGTAVAKAILIKLARKGALKDKLEEHVFDDAKKLKISSIVSYGLKPLVKWEGEDSLFSAWPEDSKKEDILEEKNKQYLNCYIEYCASELNDLLNAVKASHPEAWQIGHESKLLTPTTINGFIKCLRLILENSKDRGFETYKIKLLNVKDFNFAPYKSSHWNQLGIDLYEKFFA